MTNPNSGAAGAPGVSAPGAAPDPAPARSADDIADAMYGGTEALVNTYGPPLKGAVDHLQDATGMSAAEREQHVRDAAHTYFDARIPSEEAARIHGLIAAHAGTPASEDQVKAWNEETRKQLRERYGDDAERRLTAARTFVANRPAFAKALHESGVGAHPDVVLALAERANHIRVTPRARKG